MSSLLEIRENIRNFYSRNEVYLQPLFKFLLALVALLMINGNLGFMSKIDNIFIVLVLALMCSFLPINLLIVISAVFVILHFYAVSMECAVVGGVVFLLMLLLYYRFAPKDALIVLLLPLCFVLKIPYAIPIIVGLLCTPASVVSVACGVIVYYMMDYVKLNATVISSLDADNAVSKFRYVMDGLMNNKAMLIVLISFWNGLYIIIVFVIFKLHILRSCIIHIKRKEFHKLCQQQRYNCSKNCCNYRNIGIKSQISQKQHDNRYDRTGKHGDRPCMIYR